MSFFRRHRSDLAIINRSFWPIYPVIGEALLRFAESTAQDLDVAVIMQDHADIRARLHEEQRGKGVSFYPCRAFTTSASGIVRRIVDAAFFMVWVFGVLLWTRPKKVYVSTDPPVLVPLIAMVYAAAFRAELVYHLQDIHPEAANVVFPVNPAVFRLLRWLDAMVMRHASLLITITDEMAEEIKARSGTTAKIVVISNPAVSFDNIVASQSKRKGFSFCGNAGRLQRISLLVDAIDQYLAAGGSLPFVFAGGGVHSGLLADLAERQLKVTYKGQVSATEAAQLNADFEWALLPIEDEVTRFAFPSKSSSYVYSGAYIVAVCGEQTSVAKWVVSHRLGIVVEPDVDSLVRVFWEIEKGLLGTTTFNRERDELKRRLSFDHFLDSLHDNLLGEKGRL